MKYFSYGFLNICALVFIVSFSGRVGAETYCLDLATGSDYYSGICDDTDHKPWRSLKKINKMQFSPGDVIELKRGDIYTGIISLPAAKISGLLTLRDYGQANDPAPVVDALDHCRKPVFRSFRSDLFIENIRFTNSRKGGLYFSDSNGSRNITIRGIVVDNVGKNGINFGSKGGRNVLISDCRVSSANSGIQFLGSLANKISNVVVDGCVVRGPGALSEKGNDGIIIHETGNGETAGTNFLFQNNDVADFPEQGFDLTSGSEIVLINNKTSHNGKGAINITHTGHTVFISGHLSTDEPAKSAATFILESKNITLKNSLFYGASTREIIRIRDQDDTPAENVLIENNTFIWDSDKQWISVGDVTSAIIRNNIFYTDRQAAKHVFKFIDPRTKPGVEVLMDHNVFYSPNDVTFNIHGNVHNLESLQDHYGVEQSSYLSDPMFSDKANRDYHLLPGSVAIDGGDPLSGVSFEPSPNGARINIGRYGNTVWATRSDVADADPDTGN